MLDPIKEGAVWAIMFLPLASFSIITLVSFLGLTRDGTWSPRYSGYLTIAAMLGAFLLSLWALDTAVDADGHRVGFDSHEWLTVGSLEINIGITLDGLTALMLVVVTGVSLLVQIYSQEYMRGDEGYNRYYAFMSLFTTSMLGLALASSVLQIFVFWELVGLCSYLLIGFWFQKDSARKAATKAFLVTRIGDLGFMIALLIIFTEAGTFDIIEIHEAAIAGAIGSTALTFFALGLFAGAAGKSAQFPLHTWLPDAMEGPTPVSALIHAATMVAAGVYLVARFFPVFAESEDALVTVAAIGAITTIIAALLGIVATDIKRVMAYSTISQLGYMMMGLGVGGLVAGIFHLFTHAFFKALLFLGAGSVNHATGTFDMRLMGGLRKFMPITFATMTIGSMALVGLFPLAGFWSKDEILADAWEDDNWWVFAVAMVGVFLTALYVGRMLILTFLGEYMGGDPTGLHTDDSEVDAIDTEQQIGHGAVGHAGPHESPPLMTFPLIVLAALAIGAGFLNAPGVEWLDDVIEGWLPEHTEELVTHSDFTVWIAVSSTLIGLAGLGTAWAIYQLRVLEPERIRSALGPIPALLENRYYLDYLYQDIFIKEIVLAIAEWIVAQWDRYVIDGAVNGVAAGTRWLSKQLSVAQAGQAQLYGGVMFLGTIAAAVGLWVVNQ
ncbi:MAG TPA: NADH-quinone oxidoreductase subunit L [Dehalococcoidia bacterium]|nr:NADH-quinone oxidoreductase subunit L [Dehalococcoidia bacterium]